MFEKFPSLYTAYHFKQRYLTIVEKAEQFDSQIKVWLKDLDESPLQAKIFKRTIYFHKKGVSRNLCKFIIHSRTQLLY